MSELRPGVSPLLNNIRMFSRRQMYGHQVLREAGPRERTEWAGISPGSLYGVLSRLGDVGLIPAICTGQEGRGPPAGTPNSADSCDIGGPAPAGA